MDFKNKIYLGKFGLWLDDQQPSLIREQYELDCWEITSWCLS